VAVSGYGTSGPLVDTPAFDGILQARSGFAHVHARDSRPTGVRDYIADKVTALFTVQAVLAALIARERTGEAQTVDVPMLDSFCYFNFPELAQDRTFLESDVRLGEPRTPIVRTRDGFLGVVPASGAQVARALDAVEAPEAENELRAAPDPIQLNNTLYRVLESRTVEQPTAFWLERFSLFDVPVGPVLDFDEHFTDAQVLHNGVYAVDHHPHGGAHRVVRHPVRLGGERLPLGRRAPALGEHRDEVLSELALPAD
jgi:crotonobetainyl-CoA:carnitine CoA-transferase CaiB-like acyl-CoA transferase